MNKQNTNYYTLELNTKQINLLKTFYSNFSIAISNEYEVFRAKCNGVTITVYKSGKVSFQGKGVWGEVLTLTSLLDIKPSTNIPNCATSSSNITKNLELSSIAIGSDEVGTGDFFGPIIVSAVYVSKEKLPALNEFKVMDSKKVTDAYILSNVPRLLDILGANYSTVILSNSDYNKKYHSHNYHMNHMKAHLHYLALEQLLFKSALPNQEALIDAFTSKQNFDNYLKSLGLKTLPLKLIFEEKAESKNVAVALASMVARYEFLKYMDRLSEIIDEKLPLGCGNNVLEFAKKIYNIYGESVFSNIAKLNFTTFSKIQEPKQISLF